MIIERLSVLNFKNIEETELNFSPKMNCLFGDNGMGKTNLLDALYYLSFTKNYTNLHDSMLIFHNREFAVLQGVYLSEQGKQEIYCAIRQGKKKILKCNKKEYERLSEHIGLIPLVMISPADSELIRGGSDERRKFIDMLICQYDREYMHALMQYNKALLQRNALLKTEGADEIFDLWEERMDQMARVIYIKRKALIDTFLPVFQTYYHEIANESEQVALKYESQLHNNASLLTMLTARRERDKILGYTSAGIHKDDFAFLLDDYLIRKIGSQGQNKTYLIALKLAQFRLLTQKNTSTPLLLLDDLFDKLDAIRVERIVRLVTQDEFGQIFITDTNRQYLDAILAKMQSDYRLFQVENGRIWNENTSNP